MLIYQGSTGISIPMPRPFKHLKAELMERIADGKILLGELIEPKVYTKMVLRNGELTSESKKIHARKIPMDEIRKRMFMEHQNLGRNFIFHEILSQILSQELKLLIAFFLI